MAEILQYVHKDGFFHRLTPFSKIVFIIVISLMCIISINLLFLASLVIALLVIAYFSRLHHEVMQQSKLIVIMSVVFIIITLITMPNGAVPGNHNSRRCSSYRGELSGNPGCPRDRAYPDLQVYDPDFRISAVPDINPAPGPGAYPGKDENAHRLYPHVHHRTQIYSHSPDRGDPHSRGTAGTGYNPGTGFSGKIRSVTPIVVPLVSNALMRSNVLGLTIDMRGYRTGKRTRVRESTLQRRDYGVLFAMGIASAGYMFLFMHQIV